MKMNRIFFTITFIIASSPTLNAMRAARVQERRGGSASDQRSGSTLAGAAVVTPGGVGRRTARRADRQERREERRDVRSERREERRG